MEEANIFIGTSDSNEGWGAVINEAMNAGCAIVANKKMGSVPFLIKEKYNGFIYENYKQLEERIKLLIKDKELRKHFSKNAYNYITEEWTSKIATENIVELFETIIKNKEFELEEGPASKAKI